MMLAFEFAIFFQAYVRRNLIFGSTSHTFPYPILFNIVAYTSCYKHQIIIFKTSSEAITNSDVILHDITYADLFYTHFTI